MRVIYLLSWYEEKNEARRQELDTCLRKVIASPEIDLVYIFSETELTTESTKVHIEYVEGRVRYRDMFSAANSISKDGDVIIIANTDIYPGDQAIEKAKQIQENQCYALSRWDILPAGTNKHYSRKDSQDVWIFRAPIKEDLPGFYGMGVPGCLAGDTIIKYNRGNRSGTRNIRIENLYKRFNGLDDHYGWDNKIDTYTHSLAEDDKSLVMNKILGVIQSGIKPVVRLMFSDKTELVLTSDHKICMENGTFVEAGLIAIGTKVMTRGSMKPVSLGIRQVRSSRTYVYVKYHPYGCSMRLKDFSYIRVKKYRLVWEAEMNKMGYSEFLRILNSAPDKANSLQYLSKDLEIHHLNGNTKDDRLENLQVLSKVEHSRLHGRKENFHVAYLSAKELVSIDDLGVRMTYDIQMQDPMNNFLANNIVVHNCDNRIAKEILDSGYSISNPSKDIVFHHLHNSKIRNYKSGPDTVPGPYHFVEPCSLVETPIVKTITHMSTEKRQFGKVLHVGFDQAPLEKAFAKMSSYYKFIRWTDYQGKVLELRKLIVASQQVDKYDLVFMHIQTANIVDVATITSMKALKPDTQFINWSGDVRFPQQSWFGVLGQHLTLTCFSNETDVKRLTRTGVRGKYLQIGFDNDIFKAGEPKKVWPEIVFLGNNYGTQFPLSVARTEMVKLLATKYGQRFGVYGGNWGDIAAGNLMNDIQGEADCYRGCKIAINFSHFNYERYSSDRIFRIMGSGAFCLSHYYPGLEKDFRPGWDLDTWVDTDELIEKIDYYLGQDESRKNIAQTGCGLVHTKHTWENRLEELLKLL